MSYAAEFQKKDHAEAFAQEMAETTLATVEVEGRFARVRRPTMSDKARAILKAHGGMLIIGLQSWARI